jgi:LysM repeat protein
LALFLFNGFFESDETERVSALEQRIAYLEQQLEKIDGVDEKVTHIWEQAKAFEHFKTRFDRSEASISLRIDRLARGLDAQQKKTDSALAQIRTLEKRAGNAVPPSRSASTDGGDGAKIHIVAKGDTLYGISRRYDLSIDALRSINNLSDGDLLKVGQILVVSVPTASN